MSSYYDSQAERDKIAAEQATADGAADNDAADDGADDDGTQQVVSPDQTPARDDGAPAQDGPIDSTVDPYPPYEELDLDELRSLGESRGVVINRDVEKAQLIYELRQNDQNQDETPQEVEGAQNRYASYDVMPLEELRSLADSRDVKLDPDFEKAHWITELRAADTSGGVSVAVNPNEAGS